MKKALLMLDDGACFTGLAHGAASEAQGEVIFTTSMAGYQETLTDPSYSGQIVVFTSVHIGNYGASPLDDQSQRCQAAGMACHELFIPPNGSFPHWRARESWNSRLRRDNITCISNVDTRALTLHLRRFGARNGVISASDLNPASLLQKARSITPMQGQDLASRVSCQSSYQLQNSQTAALPMAVIDLGVKKSILDNLLAAGLLPTVWPAHTPAQDILGSNPAAVFFSNGPGDPEPCTYAIDLARKLMGRLPLFGICLGHQILGLALGGKTYKLPFGHHGVNHPVKNLQSGRVAITSQNHGFCVDPDSLGQDITLTHINLNDQTLEGMECQDKKLFSVQFHPEAAPGPSDAAVFFEQLRDMARQHTNGNAHA